MAKIIGAIATSHTPTIGFAFDRNKQHDPVWAPIFEAFAPVQQWIAERKPDVLFFIYNDHVTSFFFDHYSAFTLGIGEQYEVADEGGGKRDLPPVAGHSALARHVGRSLMADEFDMSFFQDKPLDHGCFSPLSMLCPRDPQQGWPVQIVPLQVGVLQFPVPSARRCYKLGQALRHAIESYPEDLKVAVVATGGLSHQVHGERAGFNNPAWDQQFLDLIERDPEQLAGMTQAELSKKSGIYIRQIQKVESGEIETGNMAAKTLFALADALEDHDALTATGYNLVRVGERSGKLASMLDSLARLYEEAGRNRMKRVLILLEPIAILVIGSAIGTIILGVILAITSANDLAV